MRRGLARRLDDPVDRLHVDLRIAAIAIVLSRDRYLTYPLGTIDRLLNAAPVTAAGVLSSSIYLWQEPFLYLG